MAKPKATRVPSDACSVVLDGETYYPHEGEWVELVTRQAVGEIRVRARFDRIKTDLERAKESENAGRSVDAILDKHFSELCGYLAGRIVAWNWTDDLGRPMPQPDGTVEPLMALRSEELYWMMNATAPTETEDERKNE